MSKAKAAGKVKKIWAATMGTVEMAEHRKRNGIVLLPVGCCEMHGLGAGLSCDSFLAEAACRVLAEEWEAVILPTIHYTYCGATSRWPGSVSILPVEVINYIVAVTKAILRSGFKRVVLVNLHGPNFESMELALRTVFEETGEIPIMFTPNYEANDTSFCARVLSEYGHPHDEAAAYLASLYICGRHGEFDPESVKSDVQGRTTPLESRKALTRHGAGGPFCFKRPEDHVGSYPGLKMTDAPRLAEIYREVIVEKAKGLPEDYDRFQQELRGMMAAAPWAR